MKPAPTYLRPPVPALEELENRLLLASGPDLAVAYVNSVFLQTPIVPGDKGVVTVNISNAGNQVAKGSMAVKVWASTDTVYQVTDPLIGARTGSGQLAPGDNTGDVNVNVTIPATVTPGNYYLLVQLTSTLTTPDLNAANDVASSGGTGAVAWVFGTVGARKNLRLVVNAGGGPVTFSMTGPGQGTVTPGAGGSAFTDVTVTGSTAASCLNIATTANAYTTIDTIHVLDSAGAGTGLMKSIQAKNVNLETGVVVDGWLGSLTLHDISSIVHYITLNDADTTILSTQTVSMTVHSLVGCTIDTGGIPIKRFAAADVTGTDIRAPWIGSMTVKGKLAGEGDFSGSLALPQADSKGVSLGTLAVSGVMDSAIVSVSAAVGSITAGRWDGGVLTAGYVKALTVKGDMRVNVDATEVKSAKVSGNLGSEWDCTWLTDLNVDGNIQDAKITLSSALPTAGRLSIHALTVKGWINSTTIAAGGGMTIGTVTAGGMRDSKLLAGTLVAGLPTMTSDFDTAHPSTIQKVLVKGLKDGAGAFMDSYINSVIAAWTLSDVTLNNVHWTDTGTQFGLTCHAMPKYLLKEDGAQNTKNGWVGSDDPLDPTLVAQHVGDYWVRIVSVA